MKTLILSIMIFSIAVIGVSCKRYKYPFSEKLPATASVQEGQKLYMHYCQKCHPFGEAGLGPSIYYLPSFSKKFQTRAGLGVMPNFPEHVISDEELNKITAYLKALK